MIFLQIAIRNLRKHLRRTLVIIMAVAVSVMSMLLISGMIEGMKVNFFTATLNDSGHIQIHSSGYKDRINQFSTDYRISDPTEKIRVIEKVLQDQNIKGHVEQISRMPVLIRGLDNHVGLIAYGNEVNSLFQNKIKSGMLQGTFEISDEQILISEKLADIINAPLGEWVQLIGEDFEGIPAYLDFKVAGYFTTESREEDMMSVLVTHQSVLDLLDIENETMEIRIQLDDHNLAPTLQKVLLNQKELSDLEIMSWREMHGSILLLLDLVDVGMVFMNFIILFIAVIIIANSVLMNQFDRIKEFGTLRAIGMKKNQLRLMIASEGTVQAVVGSVLGMLVGIPILLYFQEQGMYLGELGSVLGMGDMYYFQLTFSGVLLSTVFGFLIAWVCSLYAAGVIGKYSIMNSLYKEL